MSNNIKETNVLNDKQTKPVTTPSKQIGVDTDKNFLNSLLSSVQVSAIDLGKLEKFTTLSEQRSQIYDLLDYMASDSKVSAVLETYAGDCTETNDNGHIVWAESNQPQVAEYINYLLGIMNVDKYSYTWILSLCKYGDLYLRLYRNSDEDTDVIFKNAKDKIRTITEQKMQKIEEQQHKNINENVNIVVYASNDHYSHYVEMVPNPAEMFELVKHGKTYGYIKANVRITNSIENNLRQTYLQYKFKDNDVNVFEATEFVHASLSSDIDRNAEEVTLITSGDKEEKASYTYRVKRGKSLLADSYKVWRELSLLENSVILNRLTRSSIVRLVQIEVGDMPKEAVANWLLNFKQLVEQKSAINTLGENAGINEYTNPGPVENIIYVPTHEQKGSITMNTIGGDYDPKELTDLDYFLNEFYGALRVPKQYFCLRGDTKITLLTGEVVSIAEMYNNKDKYLKSGILSCNQDGTLEPTQIKDIMLTRKDATFVRVYLDNGSFIDTTPDHRFMLRDGSYKEAKDLTNTDALMPYYERISKDGRKEVLDNKLGKYILQYKLVAKTKFNSIPKGNQIHHKDCNKLNDDFTNLENLTLEEHYKKHEKMLHSLNKIKCAEKRKKGIKHGNCGKFSITNGVINKWLNKGDCIPDGFYKGQTYNYTKSGKERLAILAKKRFTNKQPWNKGLTKETNSTIKDMIQRTVKTKKKKEAQGLYIQSREHQKLLVKQWAHTHQKEMREVQLARYEKSRWVLPRTLRCPVCGKIFIKELNDIEYNKYLQKQRFIGCCKEHTKEISCNGKFARSYQLLSNCNFDYEKYTIERYNQPLRQDAYYKATSIKNIIEKYNILQYVPECNHKVVKVEQLDVVEDAFDIEVFSNNHNFALSAGVFVHNCNTDDSTGFNGGTSLSIISSRYGKEIIRIQNAFIQALTDAVNLMLLDAHLDAYIGKFTLKMQKPTTQEDVDRRSAEETTMNNMSKLLDLVSSDIQSSARRLEIVKALLPQVNVSNDILQILDDEIKEQKAEEDNNSNNEEQDELNIGPNREERPSKLPRFDTNEMQEEPENNLQSDFERMTFGNNEENTENETNVNNTETNTENEEDDNLPSPEELGQDLTITQ